MTSPARSSLAEHAGIMEAIRQGNEELAAKRLRDPVLVQGERFSDMMLNLAAAAESRSLASKRHGR
jgi:DNA-binding GntR family transcriptional regulator